MEFTRSRLGRVWRRRLTFLFSFLVEIELVSEIYFDISMQIKNESAESRVSRLLGSIENGVLLSQHGATPRTVEEAIDNVILQNDTRLWPPFKIA